VKASVLTLLVMAYVVWVAVAETNEVPAALSRAQVEIIIDYGLTDIVAERFDAGIRSGEQIAKDMIAVRMGRTCASPSWGPPQISRGARSRRGRRSSCINLRLPTRGGLYAWEFEKGGRELEVHVEGQLVFNGTFQMLNAALAGFGRATCRRTSQRHISRRAGSNACLRTGARHIPAIKLFYPRRRQSTPAFGLLVERYRAPRAA
jgi:DNA-binding transcriptional LysR family regulator